MTKRFKATAKLIIQNTEGGDRVELNSEKDTLREAQEDLDKQWTRIDPLRKRWIAVERSTYWERLGASNGH